MKLSELRARVNSLRDERAKLHSELSKTLADESQSVGELREKEAKLRAKIVSINADDGGKCYAMEVVLGKLQKIAKGTELKSEEQTLLDTCLEIVGEEITLG